MKKTLLLFLFVAANVISLTAQKSLLVSDTNYYFDRNSGKFALNNWEKHIYNSNCLDSIIKSDYTPDIQGDTTRQLSDYYPNLNPYHRIDQVWDTALHAYVNRNRLTVTYTAGNLISTMTSDLWINNSWQPNRLFTYSYDTMNAPDSVLDQVWSSSLRSYVNYYLTTYQFNGNGRIADYSYQSWDANTSTWQPVLNFTYTYNTVGFITGFYFSGENFFTGEFGLLYANVYYPDSLGRNDSSYYVDYQFNDSTRYYSTFQGSSLQPTRRTGYVYNKNGNFLGGYIYTHFYDTTATLITDSSANGTFTTTPDDAVITNISVIKSSYNQYQQITYYKYQATDPDGTIEDGRESFYQYTLCSSVLPVNFLSFTAAPKNGDAILQWQTGSEINTSFFDVQRSTDGVHFVTVGRVKATGSGNYTYTDGNVNRLASSKLYYRLAATDTDGEINYSRIASLMFTGNAVVISVSPNPVTNTINLYSPVSVSGAAIRVTDVNGSVVYASQANITAGVRFAIDASRFAKGLYVVTIQYSTGRQVIKVIK